MRICVLTHTFPKSRSDVTAAFMKALADGLVEAGNEVVVLTPFDLDLKRKGDKFELKQYKYVWPTRFHRMGYSRAMEGDLSLRWYNFFLIPFMVFFGTLSLIKLIREQKIEAISVHWILPNGVIAMLASLITGVSYCITLPGTDVHLAGMNFMFTIVARLVARQSAGVYSNSGWLLRKFFRLGISHEKNGVIKYPIDVSDYRPVRTGLEKYRTRHGIEKNEKVILAVGRLVHKKGFDYLIKAMPEIMRKYPKTKLVIGGEGDQKDEWAELARKLGMAKRVLFVGNIRRDEILYYYNLADVMVAPSVVDSLGNVDGGPVVVFESMACGKPQVVTNVLGAADHIVDNSNGFVVPQKNSKQLARVIIKLLSSAELRKRMGRRNREIVKKEFTTKAIGEKYTEVFKEMA